MPQPNLMRRRAGAATTETIVLLLSVFFPVFVYATIVTRDLLRRGRATVQSLDRGKPVEAQRVHLGRDYEQIMHRKESFPWLYDLTEQGGEAHAGETWAGARVRNRDGTVTVLEGLHDLKGSRELLRNERYAEAATWGEDSPVDDTAHAAGITPEGNRWFEGDLDLSMDTWEDPAGAARVSKDGSFLGREGSYHYLQGEGKLKIFGEEVGVKARMGGFDYAYGAGKLRDDDDVVRGLRAGASGSGLELELRKNLYEDKSRKNGAKVDLVGKLALGQVAVEAGAGGLSFKKGEEQHTGYGVRASAEGNLFKFGLGLEGKSRGYDVPFVGEYRMTGSAGVEGGLGIGAHAQALLERGKQGGWKWASGAGVADGAELGFDYSVGVEPAGD